uniref:Vg4 n=1 Tax=Tetrastichus brontispae TaxID=2033808 RepID=A0A650FKW4_9HYME|nr:Vg4 [Tetrastichus brontispae]
MVFRATSMNMARCWIALSVLAILSIHGHANGEIIKDPTLCGRLKCQVSSTGGPESRKFKYQEKLNYQYRYRVDVSANLGGAPGGNESRLYLEADVTLRFSTPCEGSLRFANVSLSHERSSFEAEFPDRASAAFKASLEQNPLRFAFDDGLVRELCPSAADEVWALNVKRGVLSMLQNTMLRFDVDRRHEELDVSGVCETEYRLHEARKTSLIVHKSKNLASCRQSGKHLSLIQSQSYRSPLSRAHALRQPLLVSGSECEITIDHNVYQRVRCRDQHKLRPLSNGDGTGAGARTEVVATLHLIGELEESPFADEREEELEGIVHSRRTNLLYDHAKSSRTIYGELRTSRDLLKVMCLLGTPQQLSPNFSETFTKFIHSARMLDYNGLSQLLSRAQAVCKTARKHIINALPYIGSNAAVNVMKDLIIKRAVDKEKVNLWITAFTLIPRPDRHTIYALAPLLDFETKIPEAQFALSYSAVVHAYCANYGPGCANLEPVRKLLKFLEDNVDKGCVPRPHAREEVRQTLEALKAIGNAGLETETLLEKLRRCTTDESGFVPMEVKLAAIEAHRRLPSCEKSRDEFFLKNYRNFTVDTEIRIASYLQVMRCPDYNVVKLIRRTLEEEQVNQVGSFVWSHLKNMLSSSSPTRIEIQSLLSDRDLGSKFNSDVRKFSRSYESSFFSEEYNFGANSQTNLIFSPKSYIPRTASVNLTVDLFGESVNLLEVNVRAEGLEYYAEGLFGPKGPFSGVKVAEHFRQLLRHLRSAEPEPEDGPDEHWRRVRALPKVIDNEFERPRLSLGYRVFGNEIKFTMLDSDREIRENLASLDPWRKIQQILSGKEIMHYENTAMFLDSSYVVPTSAGLPVRLDLSGSAACNIKLSGVLDSQRLLSDGELTVNANIMPSVSVDVTGTMTVDAFYKSAGLKLKSSMHSVSAVEADLQVKSLRLARLSWKIPSHKMEVFSLTTDVSLIKMNGAEYKEQPVGVLLAPSEAGSTPHPQIINNTTCSWSALDKLIGLKLCADYQFPNVTKDVNASYFLLNGPTKFKLSLIKADPTANSYLLEYKWTRTENESTIRVAFDTPGSQTQREISAMISFDALNNNVTMLLKSKGNSLIAQGTYKRTDNETFIDIGLDSNGVKHLDASIGYSRAKAKYGYTYSPKLYLAINNERIVNLTGIIRNQDKNSSSQCDIDLRFETKNLASHIFGYILRSNMSVSGNVKLEYRFHERSKDEVLQTEFSLINRSTKTLTYKAADVKLHSTAYPQLNFVAGMRYQHALGHVELHLEVNTSPHLHNAERHKLSAQFVATYSKPYFQTDGDNISAYVAITKPSQDIDIKVGVNYYSIGPESKTRFLIRYAPGKEITLAVNVIMPRGQLFAIEGKANLTIPNFSSMLVSAKITERARNEYELDFAGTWFSGHNISATGTYYDRSTVVVVSHQLKMLLKSPSFAKDILLNCKLYNDNSELSIGLFVEQLESDKYALVFNHSTTSPRHFRTFLEGRYKNSSYSLLSRVDLDREAALELHLDKWRDVHFIGRAVNQELDKEYGIEVKWDASRDPELKFETNVQLQRRASLSEGSRNVSALMRFSYPGRLVSGSAVFALRPRNNYLMDTQLRWNPQQVVSFSVNTDYDAQNYIRVLKLESQLLTPFENWKKTSLNGKYVQTDYELKASGSVYWQDSQHVVIEAAGWSREREDGASEWQANGALLSSVHAIQYVTANLSHAHLYGKSADSRVLVHYFPDKVIDVHSVWLIETNEQDDSFNVSGNLQLISPLVNYRKGQLKCHLSSEPNWRFFGAANLDLDKRKYTAHLVGDLAKIKESKVEFNITTPFDKYAYIRGRFGLSERNKHVVAEVTSPAGPLGLEAIFQLFTSNHNFNVKLLLATPIDVLQQAFLVAKLNNQEADFRLAYNNITAGFQGVWFYNNITNFHYSYILYTPLQGFHEIGAITKLIVSQNELSVSLSEIDTEFSLRIVDIKVGVKAHAGPKPAPPLALPVKTNPSVDEGYEEEDAENNIYYKGEIELDTVIIDPIIGTIDFDREGYTDNILAMLRIPSGLIVLEDRFQLEDFFNIKNDLSIDTPFQCASEIVSVYSFIANMDTMVYLMDMSFNVKNHSEWIETGFNVNYTYQGMEEGDPLLYSLKLDMKTPIKFLKFVNSSTALEIDENFYKANISVKSVESSINLIGHLEHDINFLDIGVQSEVDSPMFTLPKTIVNAKKDFTDRERHIGMSLDFLNEKKSSKFLASWLTEDEQLIKGSLILDTWIEPLVGIDVAAVYNNSLNLDDSLQLTGHLTHHVGQTYTLLSRYSGGKIEVDAEKPSQPRRFSFKGDLVKLEGNFYQISGDLTSPDTSEVYHVVSPIRVENGALMSVEVNATPAGATEAIQLKLHREKYGMSVDLESPDVSGSLSMNLINAFNWDLRTKLVRPPPLASTYSLVTFMNVQVNGNTSLYVELETPWEQLEKLVLDGNLLLDSQAGNVRLRHKLNQESAHLAFTWRLFYMSDMLAHLTAGHQRSGLSVKDLNALVFYANPQKAFRSVSLGFDVDVDRDKWHFATNATLGIRDQNNIDALLKIRLPPPDNDNHNLLLSYHANNDHRDLSYIVGYSAEHANSNYASDGSLMMNPNDIDGHLRLTWGLKQDQMLNNLFNISFDSKEIDFKYSLYTPKFLQQETLVVHLKYDDKPRLYTLIGADLNYPGQKRVGSAIIHYQSMINLNGSVNATTPLPAFGNVGCKFIVLTTLKQNKRFLEVYWQNNTALLDSDYTYNSQKLDANLDGHLRAEIPLNTRHIGFLTYGYRKKPLHTTGYSELIYNKDKIVDGRYVERNEARAGFERDHVNVTIENLWKPIGITYVNQYEYSAGNEGTNYPSIEYKEVTVYQLHNTSAFNVSGSSRVRTTHTGQQIELKAVHLNRTIKSRINYDVLPGEFQHLAWLSLADDAWASYQMNLVNRSTDNVEEQSLVLSLLYPRRNFTFNGSYALSASELRSEASLSWPSRPGGLDSSYEDNSEAPILKRVGALFEWSNDTSELGIAQQQAALSFRHPSFKKDVRIEARSARQSARELMNLGLSVDYSTESSRLLELNALLRDDSELAIGERKYSYALTGSHPNTQLQLDVHGHALKLRSVLAETLNEGQYKRSFLPEETGRLAARLDLAAREVEFSRMSNDDLRQLQLRFYPGHPEYVINGSAISGRELNATGAFFLNLREKLTWMMLNYTPDAVESLRMYGNVPDARNAEFQIWRTYDQDLTVSDVSFYLRLNHSRLVTSRLKWRPELKSDILNLIRTTLANAYEDFNKDIDYWKHYIRSETISVMSDIWTDAQDEIEEFLNDLNELRVIENDFEKLKVYLNNSYNANDFYIKDIVLMGVYVIDELSLRSHIQSLPKIFNEIWEIMGESGEAIRNSILWIIETMKSAYLKLSEIISAVLRGDSMNQIASIVEKLIIKYDMFIKELHVSFIKYVEYLYNQIYQTVSLQWHRFLMHIEPIFIRLAHYLETVGWKAIQEFFNFLYDRKIELISSPYYDHLSNFTQDIDKFYRDIKANDIVTNIQKYSTALIQFIRERYFAFVPFGKELKDVIEEIVSELKELRKLPSVKYAVEKIEQAYERMTYLWQYFEVRAKLESGVRLLHAKLMDISQTALQAESRYREAKTKFIYDPNNGLMCLEQKLPMSWHAFNQTPEFQEIPEYKAIRDMGSYFAASNTTFWTLYYQFKPLTEPSNWLPPFRAQAMIVGAHHFRTFDGRHFDFAGNCTYLVARDFIHDHFAILLQYNQSSPTLKHKFIVLVGRHAIELDVFQDSVKLLGEQQVRQLPLELDNGRVYVYQEESIVTIEQADKQFRLECNLKYELCRLELSGWYYGKTAGLLGTMSNEQWDDLLSSGSRLEADVGRFAHSWALDDGRCNLQDNNQNLAKLPQSQTSPESSFCQQLFANKSSEFSSCFGFVNPQPFGDECTASAGIQEVCALAVGYLQSCAFHDTYLRIPDVCTSCAIESEDGRSLSVPEGDFRKLEGDSVPLGTDVVFIIEAKECNKMLESGFEQLVVHVNKELANSGLNKVRWSLVVFGGTGVWERPRSLVVDNEIFTNDLQRFAKGYFTRLPLSSVPNDNTSEDVFEAIRFAVQLDFHAGVSKTFVLMPCSHCEPDKQTLDYSVLYHALQERGVTLHVLMPGEFQFKRDVTGAASAARLGKLFYGLDASRSYTKKDWRVLNGDAELRRQAKLSRTKLGYCAPLALETNGTIFSAAKLRLPKLGALKKFAAVFAKRLSLTARPSPCQLCECIANNDALTRMECSPCDYPVPPSMLEFAETFDEDDATGMQSIDFDYGQIDPDED